MTLASIVLAGTVTIGGFWGEQYEKLTAKWLPHCIHEMEKGGRGEELLNLVAAGDVNAGRKPSVKFKGCVFSDAYPYNVAEAMCLALELKDDPFLRGKLEEWIPIFLAAQEKSGYIHSFHALNRKPHFSDAGNHEFYVMGYFIELGIAHMRLTGGKDRRLFNAAIRCADHLDSVFGPAPKRTWTNGHPGIEYAFLRLADAVDRWDGAGKGRKYAELARFFIRSQHSTGKGVHGLAPVYNQSEQPAEDMTEARGHAVRAVYFYTGMEGVGRRLGDRGLAAAADRLFDSAVNRKMYLTGGVGITKRDEAFGPDYDLPQNGYCESCAGCGFAFWCVERAASHPGDPLPFDVYERVLYNNVLGAISADGENFYYQNPLSGDKARYPWHVCPCCVGNIPRTLLALRDNLVSKSADGRTLYVNNYMDIETDDFRMETAYPMDGRVRFTVKRGGYDRILARFPNRAESGLYRTTPEVEHGYREVKGEWTLPLPEQTVTAIPEVKACAGLVANQRGPIVYSWEGKDFGTKVANYARLNAGGESRVWVPPVRGKVREGRVALHTWFTSAEFKDIVVTGADGKVLWSGLPDPTACERDPGGNWTVDGGVLRQTNAKASDTALHFGDETWGDYAFRCKARKLGGAEGFILHVRERGRGQAIWANLGGWGNRSHGIESRGDFDFRTPLKTNCAPFETGRWYDLEVTVAGDAVTVKVDGKAVFDRVAVPEIDPNAPTVIAVDAAKVRFPVSEDMWGIFFEDISLSLDGGIANDGYFGIGVKQGQKYRLSVACAAS